MEAASKLIGSLSNLIGVIIWPAVLIFVVVRYRSGIADFFQTVSEFSWKGAGVEASVKRTQTELAGALTAAAASRASGSHSDLAEAAKTAVITSSKIITSRTLRRARNTKILWVDDRPQNNVHEREALEIIGIEVDLARSTEEALEMMASERFNVIISDMGRPLDAKAGYTLLDKLRSSGDHTPFIIYAGSRSEEHRKEARAHGALGTTNLASELLTLVLSAIGLDTPN